MKRGKTVPPNNPIIINPDISFLRWGMDWIACEKMIENTFEFPNPINPIHIYMISLPWNKDNPTIASAIIGGTSFFGGKGRIFSVVIGGLIIGTINNGLNILQVQTYYQLVVMGGLIIAAVALDRLISK